MTKPDDFLPDGTRLFNPSRPHGTVYGGAAEDGRFVQDGITYGGDRKPVGYVPSELKATKVTKQ